MRKLAPFDRSEQSTPLLILARRIHTVDDDAPEATAMLVHAGRIVAVGTAAQCRTEAGRRNLSPDTVDVGASVIVPGFVDAHAHPLMYGQMMTWVDCGPERATTIPEIVALLRSAAADLPAGRPIRGYGYEHRNLVEGRHPTRFELDQVAADREVYLMNASGHGGVVNSFTFTAHGVDRDTPDPQGGRFFRDADGELTGELSDAACNILTGVQGVKVGHHGPNFHLADEPEEHLRQLDAATGRFLAGGVTTIGDAQVSRREFDMYLRLAEAGRLPLRVSMYLLSHLLDEAIEMGLVGQFGNSRLSFAGIKLYADGTLGGWTAYFPDGYVGDPCRTGQLYHEPAEYAALIRKAHLAGLQTATHAQSPTAIEMVVSAIESALADRPDDDARHRIEHCGLPTPEQISRMAASGIRPVNQPQHYYNWGEGVEQAIGTPGERFNPLGEFVAAGVAPTISSDAPVADPIPLEAIGTAVTRVTRRGHRLGADTLRIDARTALRAHTYEGAVSLGREDDLGSLTVGKYADFVVLSEDPLAVPPERIAEIEVQQTWVDGCRRYGVA
ncbi:Amidohydrolase 3 OS=Tsukamurella paurometabola (strain ATCC 8368 / DSM / CCUG 35730 / CIP 100753/ JCM 10117 / KCTC 9821 / NBRC 16120 / NCIMB 702349 / NCTC 13040) OX=521096 GN=Tpau_4035 PE=4 SV=1 [Tsukamurella paurometabola]|uniref:Amidohydrolase 3 n=1 Tax=Tsukamurella paurometabola (strain ATCC 8368 / DSM 20162 / CCUG 35730 / CIP 100753 / JCM 10117 / KCTC 9821 / NBRC 16120 / NCIMB 702349 / NCTC 13040) TaxID=521096 RepID=D5UNB1_TSUPD|nr:amidohydrolase [Tsukamurella paurometabola]ADG80606.1 Amidohydrolase 3 [Tsukamurella paurometabola DSM 20162]SUP40261.1 N-substituted formamide deformylase precursor [Tsukamurella paurometabola]